MDMFGVMFLYSGWLMLQLADGKLDHISKRQGLHMHGDFMLAGFFPLHFNVKESDHLPALFPCNT